MGDLEYLDTTDLKIDIDNVAKKYGFTVNKVDLDSTYDYVEITVKSRGVKKPYSFTVVMDLDGINSIEKIILDRDSSFDPDIFSTLSRDCINVNKFIEYLGDVALDDYLSE